MFTASYNELTTAQAQTTGNTVLPDDVDASNVLRSYVAEQTCYITADRIAMRLRGGRHAGIVSVVCALQKRQTGYRGEPFFFVT